MYIIMVVHLERCISNVNFTEKIQVGASGATLGIVEIGHFFIDCC